MTNFSFFFCPRLVSPRDNSFKASPADNKKGLHNDTDNAAPTALAYKSRQQELFESSSVEHKVISRGAEWGALKSVEHSAEVFVIAKPRGKERERERGSRVQEMKLNTKLFSSDFCVSTDIIREGIIYQVSAS